MAAAGGRRGSGKLGGAAGGVQGRAVLKAEVHLGVCWCKVSVCGASPAAWVVGFGSPPSISHLAEGEDPLMWLFSG